MSDGVIIFLLFGRLVCCFLAMPLFGIMKDSRQIDCRCGQQY